MKEWFYQSVDKFRINIFVVIIKSNLGTGWTLVVSVPFLVRKTLGAQHEKADTICTTSGENVLKNYFFFYMQV